MERHREHPPQGRDVGEPLSHPKTYAEVKADYRQDDRQHDQQGQRKSRTTKRSPPLVFTHAQRQEDRGDREAKERYVADYVVDGADRRSFSANIDRKDPCQQSGDAIDAKEKEPGVGSTGWRDAQIESEHQSERSQADTDVS